MNRLLWALVVASHLNFASAREHLEPEDTIFANQFYESYYYTVVLRVLHDAFDNRSVARVVVFPSFEPEYAVAIFRDTDGFRVVYLESEFPVWDFLEHHEFLFGAYGEFSLETETKLNESGASKLNALSLERIEDMPVRRCELAVDQNLGETLVTLWRKMLYETRYKEGSIPKMDGVRYHFSTEHRYQTLAGQIWSPDPSSETGKLVKVGESLRAACTSGNSVIPNEVESISRELMRSLDGGNR